MSSRGVNKAIVVGNLGQDPEVRYMPSGAAVANFSLATSEEWKDKQSGEDRKETEWHRCTAFGKVAEIIGEHAKKGSKLYVEGSLKTRSWDKDGQKHYSTEIKVRDFQFVDSPREGGVQDKPDDYGPPPEEDFDDDIPF